MRGVTNAFTGVTEFQRLFSLTYSALRKGARPDTRIPADDEARTSFRWSYCFAASRGVVFTIPNERLLFEVELDETVKEVFEMGRLRTSAEIKPYAQRLGKGGARELYQWSKAH